MPRASGSWKFVIHLIKQSFWAVISSVFKMKRIWNENFEESWLVAIPPIKQSVFVLLLVRITYSIKLSNVSDAGSFVIGRKRLISFCAFAEWILRVLVNKKLMFYITKLDYYCSVIAVITLLFRSVKN